MTVIIGWRERERKPVPSRSFADDPAFNGSNLRNSRAATAASERLARVEPGASINTETLKPADKHRRLVRASI